MCVMCALCVCTGGSTGIRCSPRSFLCVPTTKMTTMACVTPYLPDAETGTPLNPSGMPTTPLQTVPFDLTRRTRSAFAADWEVRPSPLPPLPTGMVYHRPFIGQSTALWSLSPPNDHVEDDTTPGLSTRRRWTWRRSSSGCSSLGRCCCWSCCNLRRHFHRTRSAGECFRGAGGGLLHHSPQFQLNLCTSGPYIGRRFSST